MNYRALADFRYELRRFLNFSEKAARAVGLEPRQHQALLAIKALHEAARATVGALAERMQIRPNSAVELADRLAARGLLLRAHNAADERVVRLKLTVRGERMLTRLSGQHHAELRIAGPRLIRALQTALRGGHHRKPPRRDKRRPER